MAGPTNIRLTRRIGAIESPPAEVSSPSSHQIDRTQRNVVRLEQSLQELENLTEEIGAWHRERAYRDKHGCHRTQLECLRKILDAALEAIRSSLRTVSANDPSGDVYEQCRGVDQRTLIVRRLWQFFAEKWDQRDDPSLGPILAAADEVVWSCWAGPFRKMNRVPPAAPLPYIDPLFSAHATLRIRPPQQVKTSDDLLGSMLAKLPIPLIGLPPICVQRPWWLVAIAHETGHHIAYDLLDEPSRKHIQGTVSEALQAHDKDIDPTWSYWTHELFADVFAIACVGETQLWAVEELELASDKRMVVNADQYPPAVVRCSLNRAALETLTGQRVETDDDSQSSTRPHPLMAASAAVARALIETPLGEHTCDSLRALCGWQAKDFEPDGEVNSQMRELLSSRQLVTSQHLDAARLAIASSVTAWKSVSSEPDATLRQSQRENLRQRTIDLLCGCHETGTRATEPEDPGDVVDLADELAQMLINTQLEV